MVIGSLVSVVDDDESVRESLPDLLREFGFAVQAFASAEEFLASPSFSRTTCLILDVRMPGMDGLELQRRLVATGWKVPIVFISAHADDQIRAQALQAGAFQFFDKPFSSTALLEAIAAARLDLDR